MIEIKIHAVHFKLFWMQSLFTFGNMTSHCKYYLDKWNIFIKKKNNKVNKDINFTKQIIYLADIFIFDVLFLLWWLFPYLEHKCIISILFLRKYECHRK